METTFSFLFQVFLELKISDKTFRRHIKLPVSPFPGLDLNLWVGYGFKHFRVDRIFANDNAETEEFSVTVILAPPPVEEHKDLIRGLTRDGAWKQN